MKKLLVLILALVISISLVACGGAKDSEPEENTNEAGVSNKKIAFITGTGGLGDKNLNDFNYEGVKKHEENGVQVDVVEPQEVADFENLQKLFAERKEYSVIVTVGFEQVEPLIINADAFPEQNFIIIDAVVEKPNVASLLFKSEETGFQLGALAALILEEGNLPNSRGKNTIGFVGGMDIPVINQFAAGYEAGAKYVNPDIKVDITYVGSFQDPSKANELATGLYESGADIIFACAGGSGLGVINAAESSNGYAFGIETNQNVIAPDHVIASGTRRWDKAIYELTEKALKGEFQSGIYSYGIRDDAVDVERSGSNVEVSQEIMDKLNEFSKAIGEGKLVPPTELQEVENFLNKL